MIRRSRLVCLLATIGLLAGCQDNLVRPNMVTTAQIHPTVGRLSSVGPITGIVFTDLGSLPGGGLGRPFGVNNSGVVVGEAQFAPTGSPFAFVRTAGPTYTQLVFPGDLNGYAAGVNDNGMVAGGNRGSTGLEPFVWTAASGMQALATPSHGGDPPVRGINGAGEVVGECTFIGATDAHACFWPTPSSPPFDLGVLQLIASANARFSSTATAIDQAGDIAGFNFSFDQSTGVSVHHAFLWQPKGGMIDLGVLPGDVCSFGTGMNDQGQVVGVSSTTDQICNDGEAVEAVGGITSNVHGFIWTAASGMQPLGSLPTGSGSFPRAINNSGVVVGFADGKSNPTYAYITNRPFVWTPLGGMRDLGSPTNGPNGDPEDYAWASAINDQNQIVGSAFLGSSTDHPVMWTLQFAPVNPPSSPALTASLDPGVSFAFMSPGTLARANAVNNKGLVVGDVGANNLAAVWTAAGGTVELDDFDGTTACCSTFNAVNASGNAVGTTSYAGLNVVYYWSQSTNTKQQLGNLTGGQNTRGAAIDDNGDIAGYDDGVGPFFRPNGGTIAALPLGSTYTHGYATGMNSGTSVVGAAWGPDNVFHAVEWPAHVGPVVSLPSLGGSQSWTTGINNAGDIVGWSELTPGNATHHAALWPASGGVVDLTTWINGCVGTSEADAVSNGGIITGRCNNLPVVWSALGGMRQLPLPPGAVSGEPHGMNDSLTIVGTYNGFGGAMWTVSNHPPVPVIGGPYFGIEGHPVAFVGKGSSDPDGDAITYAWDFGDGATATTANPHHTYGDIGAYQVTLTVTDVHGAYGTATTTATIETAVPLITVGELYSCALRASGTAACWGGNPYGANNVPTTQTYSQLSGGFATTCGLQADATIACYGSDGSGQNLAPPGTFVEVSTGQYHACALASTSIPSCWGSPDRGETVLPAGSYAQVSAGWQITCGLRSDGTVVCVGNLYPSSGGTYAPPAGTFIQVSAGGSQACGLKPDRSIVCWGDNTNGGVGGSPASGFTTVAHPGTYRDVRSGQLSVCALATDGTISCWGYNGDGRANAPAGNTFVRVAVGSGHACAERADGTITCWGDNTRGQTNVPSEFLDVPVAQVGGPYVGNEGTAIAFDGTASTGAHLRYAWSFGDGATATAAKPSHKYANNGSYTVTLTVTDGDSVTSSPATTTATITNVAPTGTFTLPTTPVPENAKFTISIRNLVDPGHADTEQYAFDCGDGLGYSAWASTTSAQCTPSDNGTLNVAGKVRDDDGGESDYTGTVIVTNVPPTATFKAAPHSVNEGSAFTLGLTKPNDAPGDLPSLQYAFDCGDPANPGYGALSATALVPCATTDNGTRIVRGKVADKDGGVTEYIDTVAVTNVAPSVVIDSLQTAGLPPRQVVVWYHFTDPGINDGGIAGNLWQVSASAGNGQTATVFAASATEMTVGFVYTAAGTYTVTVAVTDKDGGVGVKSANVRIK